ncbi:hypothetical protein KIN20_006530 [Parelaphostrongylus tenuis]|uniref:Nuclear transcription factor Y subunit beta n=1 Tax=Parelaphostrongylus tenuis TaxID=148309 RepID=A0AAD5M682_PARTN|nr:hypothetical protein KIN20_006530 [Parelaphostrongylus tenuis]
MSDDDGKEFMVHFADDRDVENMEEDLEIVGNDGMKIRFQRENGDEETPDTRSSNPIPDQERFLPIANVARVMKRMIPSSGKIAKDAKECVQECVSEFISFITSEANDKCLNEKRKTISADDLLEAITNMGFDNYVAPLQLFLERYRAAHKLNSAFSNTNTTSRSLTTSDTGEAGMDNGQRSSVAVNRGYSPRPVVTLPQATSTATTVTEHTYQSTSSNSTPVVLSGGLGGMSVTALQQQPMQIYVDPASKQHYMAIETEQAMQLYPIQIQTDGPVAYSFAPDIASTLATSNGGGNQTFIMMATGDMEEGSVDTMCSTQTNRIQSTPSRSVTVPRTHRQNEVSNRQQSRNGTTPTTTYVTSSAQDENQVQTRSSQKRDGAGCRGGKEKVMLSTKRTRHS